MMKNNKGRLNPLLALALSLTAFASTGCSELRIYTDYAVTITEVAVPTNVQFAAEDEYKIVIANHKLAYVYLLRKEPTGSYRTLFPDPAINGGNALVFSEATVVLPLKGAYAFPPENGALEFVIIVDRAFDRDLFLLAQSPLRDGSVVEDIIATYAAKPGTQTWRSLAPSNRRVGTGTTPRSPPAKFDGHSLVIFSRSSNVGAVQRFTLRHEIR